MVRTRGRPSKAKKAKSQQPTVHQTVIYASAAARALAIREILGLVMDFAYFEPPQDQYKELRASWTEHWSERKIRTDLRLRAVNNLWRDVFHRKMLRHLCEGGTLQVIPYTGPVRSLLIAECKAGSIHSFAFTGRTWPQDISTWISPRVPFLVEAAMFITRLHLSKSALQGFASLWNELSPFKLPKLEVLGLDVFTPTAHEKNFIRSFERLLDVELHFSTSYGGTRILKGDLHLVNALEADGVINLAMTIPYEPRSNEVVLSSKSAQPCVCFRHFTKLEAVTIKSSVVFELELPQTLQTLRIGGKRPALLPAMLHLLADSVQVPNLSRVPDLPVEDWLRSKVRATVPADLVEKAIAGMKARGTVLDLEDGAERLRRLIYEPASTARK